VVRGAVRVVATEAGDAAPVHDALHEVVALHPILVRRPVGEMRERRLSELVLFEPPEVLEMPALMESHGPIEVPSLDRVVERLPLRVALDARVVRPDEVEPRRVDDRGCRGAGGVLTSRAVT